MRRRHALAAVALLALVATSGCTTLFGPGQVDRDALVSEDASYEWNESAAAYLDVGKNEYTAVYDVGSRTTGRTGADDPTIELYERDALGTENPLEVRALQFRFTNGTRVVYVRDGGAVTTALVYPNGTREEKAGLLGVERTRKRAVVSLPADEGRLAFATDKNGKQVGTPTFVAGTYEMVLPEGARVGVPLLAQVRPGAEETFVEAGRVHVRWAIEERTSAVVVRYYLQRDLLIFGTLVAALVLVGAGGTVYYYRKIRQTVRRREEVGLDVDVEDDDRRDPPPGMG